jgi:hypothetical protein
LGIAQELSPKDGGNDDDDDFHGQRRSNDTHESVTDPDA